VLIEAILSTQASRIQMVCRSVALDRKRRRGHGAVQDMRAASDRPEVDPGAAFPPSRPQTAMIAGLAFFRARTCGVILSREIRVTGSARIQIDISC